MIAKLSAALCGGVSLLALASPALAQQATAPAAAQLEEVVVTGTHIRDGFTAPTPVTVATAAQLEATTPSTIPDALNKLPQPHHPVFNVPDFKLASQTRFFLCIEAEDHVFEAKEVENFLHSLGAIRVQEVEK